MNEIDWDQHYLDSYKNLLAKGFKYTCCASCAPDGCIHKMDIAKMTKTLQEKIDRKAAGQCGCLIGQALAEVGRNG